MLILKKYARQEVVCKNKQKRNNFMLILKKYVRQEVVCENKQKRNDRNESKYSLTLLTFKITIIIDCDKKNSAKKSISE